MKQGQASRLRTVTEPIGLVKAILSASWFRIGMTITERVAGVEARLHQTKHPNALSTYAKASVDASSFAKASDAVPTNIQLCLLIHSLGDG